MLVCLGQGADLHMAQMMLYHSLSLAPGNPDWFTFLVPAHPGSPGQNPESRKTIVVVVVVVVIDCHYLTVCCFRSTVPSALKCRSH